LSNKPISIVYIMGSGRSGSTLLDRLLGMHEGLVSLGELQNAVYHGWMQGAYCSCGAPSRDCPFWGTFFKRWIERFGDRLDEWLKLQWRFELPAYKLLIRAKPDEADADWQTYRRYATAAFEILTELAGDRILVDSSKTPSRALRLADLGMDLRLVHLVRDGRGVAWSIKKSFDKNLEGGIERTIMPRSALRTALFWVVRNRHCETVMRQLKDHRSLRLRYEDLVADPARRLDEIQERLDLPHVPGETLLAQTRPRSEIHLIAGNRMRMQDKIKIKPDLEWQERLTGTDRAIFALVAGQMLRRYDYA
jgi:hypothetical protein